MGPYGTIFFVYLIFILCSFSNAQPSTSVSLSASAATSDTRTTSLSVGTTSAIGTTTLSANGTATATIINGTAVNINETSTPPTSTSTSTAVFPTLSGVSSCVVNCLTTSVAQINCTAITDIACYCSNAIFRNNTVACVSSQCPSELSGAESLAEQFCNLVSVTLTFPTPTTTSAVSRSSSSSPPSGNGTRERIRSPFLAALSCAATLFWFVSGG
ncbi:hypothetical protein K439DRAFT_363568 [Ramaria rubella]|nr:hypothetical protein K439DRAFT_363568 [Ramaria rubella]